jgi:hypothetical protein
MTSATPDSAYPLKFSSLSSQVDPSFWTTLSSLKLNVWKLDALPKLAYGIYSTPVRPTPAGDGIVEFNAGAFDATLSVLISADNRAPDGYALASGTLVNFNTEEEWRTNRILSANALEGNVLSHHN